MMIFKRLLGLGLIFMFLLAGCDAVSTSDEGLIEASGVVEATVVSLSPQVSGTVVELYAVVGDYVSAGDQIMLIENEILQAQYNQAQAAFDSAQAAQETAESALASADAGLVLANLDVEKAEFSISFLCRLRDFRNIPSGSSHGMQVTPMNLNCRFGISKLQRRLLPLRQRSRLRGTH